MVDFIKTVDRLEYNYNFHSKTQAHFCVVNLDSKKIYFCFDWDIPNKRAFQFLDSDGIATSDDNYPIPSTAIEHMERMFNLKAFF